MKKLLLSLLSLVAVTFISAATEPASITFEKGSTDYEQTQAYNTTWKSADGMFSFSAFNNNKNGWDYIAAGWKTDATKPTILTLIESPAAISDIVLSIGPKYTKDQVQKATLYVATDASFEGATTTDILSLLPDAANSDMKIEVTNAQAGSFVKIEFEIPKQSANGSVLTLTKVVINYAEAGTAELKPAGLSFSEAAVTVTTNKLEEFTAPTLTNPNNLAVTYTTSDDKVATVATDGAVTLTGTVGTAKITASFAGNNEYREGEASYTITVKEAPKAVATVAATKELAAKTDVVVNYALTVGYANKGNIFACDAAGDFIQVYYANATETSFKSGDVLPAGWEAVYDLYSGTTPELVVASVAALPAATEGSFAPKSVAAADIAVGMVNSVVKIENVVFEAATPSAKSNFTGKVGETSLTFRNNYTLEAQEAGTYNVTVVVTVYSNAVQLYPIAYELVSGGETPEPVDPEVTEVKTVAETIALATDTKVKIGYSLTVGWKSYSNVFACDEAGDFIQLYGSNTLKVGDVIPAGWEATYVLYNGVTPELTNFTLPEATEGTFTPKTVAPADITVAMVNSVVKIENVVFDTATPGADVTDNNAKNFTGKVGDVTVNLRNNYKLESVEAGKYNVTVVVTIFQNAPSLYVTNFEKVVTDGIDEIETEGAEAVYYNLQGVEVKNPANGVYIVRRGANVTKEFIR